MRYFDKIFVDSKVNFMKMHGFAFFLSVFLVLGSFSLLYLKGLNFGIDFSGGILIEADIEGVSTSEIREVFAEKMGVQVQNIGGDNFLLRVAGADYDQVDLIKRIQGLLNAKFEQIDYRKVDYVGPQVGGELVNKGAMALLLSFFFIMIYVWARFDWQFGMGALLALLHDAIFVFGFYAWSQIEFSLTSVAAILTVIGYSVNDSVVIYDRIRENLRKMKKAKMRNIINSSLNSTLSRTFLTTFTTLLSLLALVLFGGSVLQSFSLGAFVGVIVGVYSSVYISAPVLLYFDPRIKTE